MWLCYILGNSTRPRCCTWSVLFWSPFAVQRQSAVHRLVINQKESFEFNLESLSALLFFHRSLLTLSLSLSIYRSCVLFYKICNCTILHIQLQLMLTSHISLGKNLILVTLTAEVVVAVHTHRKSSITAKSTTVMSSKACLKSENSEH